jgi:hypothetical protein
MKRKPLFPATLLTLCFPGIILAQNKNITISDGVDRNVVFLSVPTDGSKADLWSADDGSGRQRWWFPSGPNEEWFNVVVGGGVDGNRKYLSASPDGTKVDLYPADDGSGRQRWVFERAADGNLTIRVFGGISNDRKFLSVTSDGTKVDLYPVDDGSGRQRWKVTDIGVVKLFVMGDETTGDCEMKNARVLVDDVGAMFSAMVRTRKTMSADFWRLHLEFLGPVVDQRGNRIIQHQIDFSSPPLHQGDPFAKWLYFIQHSTTFWEQVTHRSSC